MTRERRRQVVTRAYRVSLLRPPVLGCAVCGGLSDDSRADDDPTLACDCAEYGELLARRAMSNALDARLAGNTRSVPRDPRAGGRE